MRPLLAKLPPLVVPAEAAAHLTDGTRREWLETNGLGSFAMGTAAGPNTRRYHALLCAATRPPVARMVLVNRCEEAVVVDGIRHELGTNFYPGAVWPDGNQRLVEFRLDPWPTWVFRCGSARVERTVFMPQGRQLTLVSWRLLDPGRARLFVRPLLSGRDHHVLHRENTTLRTHADIGEGLVVWEPYPSVPAIYCHHNGVYVHKPDWYRRFQYPREQERGLDFEEDLFAPGELGFDLVHDAHAVIAFTTEGRAVPDVTTLRASERDRRQVVAVPAADDGWVARLAAAARAFIVERAGHRTIIAGYPWFTDWGRDTFVSLPGLALATGEHALARELLLAFVPHLRDGLLPNRFPDEGEQPEYNSVDAPLWFVLAACRYARVADDRDCLRERLLPAMRQILEAYLAGTRFGIGVDDDGLLHAAAPGLQLTWMDAKVGDWVVTPRAGKPVEVQALWVAALEAVSRVSRDLDAVWAHELEERAAWARSSFAASFWNDELGWMYDVIDGPTRDATLRPNQLYALGLCAPLVDDERARRALDACERELLTRVGLRSRARDEQYRAHMIGDQAQRDAAYHQGTVWPYLFGVYADACRRVRGHVHPGLLDGLRAHLEGEGLGQLPEVFDGDAPHVARGCPAQAWTVAECLRIAAGQVGEDA
jgi:predicted glycogen debranching enzyme